MCKGGMPLFFIDGSCWVERGITAAMNEFNGKAERPTKNDK